MKYSSMLCKTNRKIKFTPVMLIPLLTFTSCGKGTDYYIHGGREYKREDIINVDEEIKNSVVKATSTAKLTGYVAESRKTPTNNEDEDGEEQIVEMETFLYANLNVFVNFGNKYFEEIFSGKYVYAEAAAQFFPADGWVINLDSIALYGSVYEGYFFGKDPEKVQREYDETVGMFFSFFFSLDDQIISRAVQDTNEKAIIEQEQKISDEFRSKLRIDGDTTTGNFSIGLTEAFSYKDEANNFLVNVSLFRFDFKDYLLQEGLFSYYYSFGDSYHAKEQLLRTNFE